MVDAASERRLLRALLASASAPDLERFLAEVLGLLTDAVDAACGYVALGDGATTLRPQWFRAHPPELASEIQRQISTGVLSDAVLRGEPVFSADLAADPRYRERASVRGAAGVPVACLPVEDVGVVYVAGQRTHGVFDESAIALLRLATEHLAPLARRMLRSLALDGPDATAAVRKRLVADGIVGRSRAIADVLERIAVCAPKRVPVLLTGPSGTGKTALARVVHRNGPSPKGPFVALNCADLDPTRLQADLFGARAQSYSGLTRDRPGLVEAADGGTLFLDEIGEIPRLVQAQLLGFLQDRTYRWLGDTTERTAGRVRLVAATNRDLRAEVALGRFREDLWFRLSVFEIHVPPLAARRADLPVLCHALVDRLASVLGVRPLPLAGSAHAWLEAQAWPGNVRELENVLQRALLWADAEQASALTAAHLERPTAPLEVPRTETLAEATRRFEQQYVARVLAESRTRAEAARRLGIHRTHVYDLLRRLDLSDRADTGEDG